MDNDPTFSRRTTTRKQATAVAAWKHFLERDDLSKEHEVFAWWRLGSLLSYNFDIQRGEKPDLREAERAMKRVRIIDPDLVSGETLSSATIFGSLPGKPEARVQRLAKAYNWISTRGEKQISKSISRVSHVGYVVDGRLTPGGGKRNLTTAEKRNFLRRRIADALDSITTRISEEIECSQNPSAIEALLKTVKTPKNSKAMKEWEKMYQEVRSRYPPEQEHGQ